MHGKSLGLSFFKDKFLDLKTQAAVLTDGGFSLALLPPRFVFIYVCEGWLAILSLSIASCARMCSVFPYLSMVRFVAKSPS